MRPLLILFAGFFCLSPLASGETPSDVYDLPKVVAVQNRAFQVNSELTVQAGYLPSDAFNKGYVLGTSYTHFFSDYLGWEVVDANYVINSPTGLKGDLLDCCETDVISEGFDGALDFIQWYVLTNLVYTPLYTKALLFNKDIVRGEISFVGGAGGAKFADTGLKPMISLGLYARFFTRPDRSWKFDFRNNIYMEESLGAVNSMSLIVGYSIHFGGAPQTKPAESMDDL